MQKGKVILCRICTFYKANIFKTLFQLFSTTITQRQIVLLPWKGYSLSRTLSHDGLITTSLSWGLFCFPDHLTILIFSFSKIFHFYYLSSSLTNSYYMLMCNGMDDVCLVSYRRVNDLLNK